MAGPPNAIRIGLKCTKRIQSHAYATAVILNAISKPQEERQRRLAAADKLLNWAVGAELALLWGHRGPMLPEGHVLRATDKDIPHHVLAMLGTAERSIGQGLYRYSLAWILLHELCHLRRGHSRQTGLLSWEQEKEADRFAAEWIIEAASDSPIDQRDADRLCALMGIAVSLLWPTIGNVFIGGRESRTHPEGYDRLFQVLDHVIDRTSDLEHERVWRSVATLLFIHMDSAGFNFSDTDAIHMRGGARDEVNHLINRLVARCRRVSE